MKANQQAAVLQADQRGVCTHQKACSAMCVCVCVSVSTYSLDELSCEAMSLSETETVLGERELEANTKEGERPKMCLNYVNFP